MSTSRRPLTSDFNPERIEEIMKAARRERNEAIGQLFGFGFTVVKDALRTGLGRKDRSTHKPAMDGACG